MVGRIRLFVSASAAALLLASCGGGSTAVTQTPSPSAAGLPAGLIAYASGKGISVIDPLTDKTAVIAPLPGGGAFRVAGPVWGPAPDVAYPVIYFAIHDDRPIAFSPDGTMAALSLPDHGAVIEPVNLRPVFPSPSPTPGSTPLPSSKPSALPSPSTVAPRRVNSRLPHVDSLAWSPDSKQLAVAVNGGIQLYSSSGKDGDKALRSYAAGSGVTALDWSGAITGRTLAGVKPGPNPQSFVDALLTATKLPAAADTSANRPFTKIYLWAFDSSKASPIASIADASPAVLEKYPPLAAMVNFHHWVASETWALTGGCTRYRVVVAGSIAPMASTFGLQANTPCLGASPSASPSK